MPPAGAGIRFLLINLALQNLGRRKARTPPPLRRRRHLRRQRLHRRRADAQHRAQHGCGFHPAGRRYAGRAGRNADQHHRRAADGGAHRPHPRCRHAGAAEPHQGCRADRAATDLPNRCGRHRPSARDGRSDRFRSRARFHDPTLAGGAARSSACARTTSSSAGAARSRSAPSFWSSASPSPSMASSARPPSAPMRTVCS